METGGTGENISEPATRMLTMKVKERYLRGDPGGQGDEECAKDRRNSLFRPFILSYLARRVFLLVRLTLLKRSSKEERDRSWPLADS